MSLTLGQWTVTIVQYNTAGSVVKTIDAAGHQTQVSYTDAFAANGTTLDTGLPLTLAYLTTLTDPDNYTAKSRYNYQFGAPTWKQTPQPNTVVTRRINPYSPKGSGTKAGVRPAILAISDLITGFRTGKRLRIAKSHL